MLTYVARWTNKDTNTNTKKSNNPAAFIAHNIPNITSCNSTSWFDEEFHEGKR
jgi:hypothetical protein